MSPSVRVLQGAAAYPENEDQQQRLREAAEGLRVATNAAAQNAIKKKLVNRLEVSHRSRRDVFCVLFDLDSSTTGLRASPLWQQCHRNIFFPPHIVSPLLSKHDRNEVETKGESGH